MSHDLPACVPEADDLPGLQKSRAVDQVRGDRRAGDHALLGKNIPRHEIIRIEPVIEHEGHQRNGWSRYERLPGG